MRQQDETSKWASCIVTGGAGFIGSHICEEALKLGKKVTCIDNLIAGKEENMAEFRNNPNFKFVREDITHRLAIIPHFEDIDIVFHNAASKAVVCREDPKRDLEVNAWGTYIVAQCAATHGIKKLVHASTGSVYGEPIYYPCRVSETHPVNPVSFYGVSKLAGEKYLKAFYEYYGLKYSVLRYFHVYGPRQESSEYGGVIPIFIRRALNDEPLIIYGDGTQTRSFTYVKDDVKANFLLSDPDTFNGWVLNSASGIRITITELANMVLKLMRKEDLEIKYEDWRPGDIKYMEVDNNQMCNLGLEFETDFESGLKRTIAWYKESI